MKVTDFEYKILEYGKDILDSSSMQQQKLFRQHGDVSVFEHSVFVAYLSLYIASRFHIKVDEKALVRGALLHDYFLYDWHIRDNSHRLHGFRHAKLALKNASDDFDLGRIEKDIIAKHMFPLNIICPIYKESFIVCFADKISAVGEVFFVNGLRKRYSIATI